MARRDGLRLPSGEPVHTEAKLAALLLSAALVAELAPLRVVLEPLNAQIADADARLGALAAGDPVVARIQTVPGIGPVTAVAFVATLDDVTRFANAHQLEVRLGLTPREFNSGERQHRGWISKTGNPRLRVLLVEVGWWLLRSHDAAATPLRAWAEWIATRPGYRAGRAGASTGGYPVRDVARRGGLPGVRRGVAPRRTHRV